MRHRVSGNKLSRTASHRKAMFRNMVTSLFEHERVRTTVPKAREARRIAERLITKAKRGTVHDRRMVASYVRDEKVVKKLFETIAPWYADRPGGYTRLLKLGNRLGDGGEMGLLELVKTGDLLEKDLAVQRERAEKRAERKVERAQAAAAAAEAAAAEAGVMPPEDDEDEDEGKTKKSKEKAKESSAKESSKKSTKTKSTKKSTKKKSK